MTTLYDDALALMSTSSPALQAQSRLARAAAACLEAALLAEAAVAYASIEYADRQQAQAAIQELAATAEPALERIAEHTNEEVWRAASDAVQHAIEHLSRTSLDLKPVVLVESMRSFPSTVLAWRLYGDPERAEELVSRNGVTTSLFMPTSLEALAS